MNDILENVRQSLSDLRDEHLLASARQIDVILQSLPESVSPENAQEISTTIWRITMHTQDIDKAVESLAAACRGKAVPS